MQTNWRKYVIACVFVVVCFFIFTHHTNTQKTREIFPTHPLCIENGATFFVAHADTPHLHVLGLSNTQPLKEKEGMLFIFSETDIHPFWMKDMSYPIDIIWLDENKQVVHVEEHVSPETFPHTFQNPTSSPARYVLELRAGSVAQYTIRDGVVFFSCSTDADIVRK